MNRTQLISALGVLTVCSTAPTLSCGQESPASTTSNSSASEAGKVDEVVVTAERRSERLQDVPIDVSVISGAATARLGITTNMTLENQIPSFQASRQNTGATIYLRGIGTTTAPGVENAVATYVDDVYITGFSSTIVGFNNIDRVEVLKGPQGTLFGRNATGGVIHIVTRDPSSTPALDIQAGYGNLDTISSNLYGTTGIGSTVAIDLAVMSRNQRNGYGRDLTTGQDTNLGKEYGVRSKLKWTPTDATTVLVSADYYRDTYDYGLNQTSVPGTLSAGDATFAGNYNTQGNNPFSPQGPGRSGHDRDIDGQSVTLTHEFSWATFKSISARRMTRDFTSYDQDGGPGHYNDARWPSSLEEYSEELHLSSPDSAQLMGHKFHWLGGLYFLKMNDVLALSTSGGLLGGGQLYVGSSTSYTRSYSAFYDATLEVAPGTNLTLGVRETKDRIKNLSSSLFVTGDGTPFLTVFPELHGNASKPTYRAVLDHRFTDGLMVYGSVSRGFKSGGFSLFGPGTPATLPEIVDAYALGMKSDWLDHRFQVNAEVFDYNYKNQQVQVIKAGGLVGINAAESKIYGADVSFTAVASEDLSFTGNFGYLHGKYSSFEGAPIYLQSPATCDPVPHRLPGALIPGNILCAFDATGERTIRSPKFSGNVGVQYRMLKGVHGNLDVTANYFYTTSFSWDISGQYPEPSYNLLSASLMWTDPSAKYDVQVFCSNCTNHYHDTFIAESGPEIQKAGADPRLYGLKVGVHF